MRDAVSRLEQCLTDKKDELLAHSRTSARELERYILSTDCTQRSSKRNNNSAQNEKFLNGKI